MHPTQDSPCVQEPSTSFQASNTFFPDHQLHHPFRVLLVCMRHFNLWCTQESFFPLRVFNSFSSLEDSPSGFGNYFAWNGGDKMRGKKLKKWKRADSKKIGNEEGREDCNGEEKNQEKKRTDSRKRYSEWNEGRGWCKRRRIESLKGFKSWSEGEKRRDEQHRDTQEKMS